MKTIRYKPAKGRYLLSEPFLADPNFKRTVVLLTEHGEEGSIGFVLNRPTKLRLNQVLEDFPKFESNLYIGGPVQQETLHFIHRVEKISEGAIPIGNGVWWGGDFDLMKLFVESGQAKVEDFRFFLGYSGWSPDQLNEELKAKSWIVAPTKADLTFSKDHKNLWRQVLKGLGPKYQRMSNYPVDPSDN